MSSYHLNRFLFDLKMDAPLEVRGEFTLRGVGNNIEVWVQNNPPTDLAHKLIRTTFPFVSIRNAVGMPSAPAASSHVLPIVPCLSSKATRYVI